MESDEYGPAAQPPDAGLDDAEGFGPDAAEPFPDNLDLDRAERDLRGRLWIRTLIPLLQLRSQDADPSGRVQFALDRMHIAACERIARILHSDIDFQFETSPPSDA